MLRNILRVAICATIVMFGAISAKAAISGNVPMPLPGPDSRNVPMPLPGPDSRNVPMPLPGPDSRNVPMPLPGPDSR
jgi:hypothetical protein